MCCSVSAVLPSYSVVYLSAAVRDLHSFPTRRSSDLGVPFLIGLAALTVASISATLRGVSQALILVTGHCGDEEDSVDWARSEEHTSELQSLRHLVCRLLLEKKNRRRDHRQTSHQSIH